mmetsp:Transcript_130677/g.326060  ORF Transcript_130677/g.326060 Transcript_130677/m.326060 type:complete len:296 (+) Transcript_130677:26-913(+)|eukprot:CAMPEP_0115185618 /NCGR_PEP_ID=MMETSP0270-20121206/9563_1 /TAXON_ID=71861 /ORGANISM="Scrippsiella trochoidea, Strain CCMP3099" /LENGTH=295 /DNA_ID=CAMNT_0002598725 /DNA_START=21 /DNA_END=908 /DNA_ORIENTATION=+
MGSEFGGGLAAVEGAFRTAGAGRPPGFKDGVCKHAREMKFRTAPRRIEFPRCGSGVDVEVALPSSENRRQASAGPPHSSTIDLSALIKFPQLERMPGESFMAPCLEPGKSPECIGHVSRALSSAVAKKGAVVVVAATEDSKREMHEQSVTEPRRAAVLSRTSTGSPASCTEVRAEETCSSVKEAASRPCYSSSSLLDTQIPLGGLGHDEFGEFDCGQVEDSSTLYDRVAVTEALNKKWLVEGRLGLDLETPIAACCGHGDHLDAEGGTVVCSQWPARAVLAATVKRPSAPVLLSL